MIASLMPTSPMNGWLKILNRFFYLLLFGCLFVDFVNNREWCQAWKIEIYWYVVHCNWIEKVRYLVAIFFFFQLIIAVCYLFLSCRSSLPLLSVHFLFKQHAFGLCIYFLFVCHRNYFLLCLLWWKNSFYAFFLFIN